MNLSRSANSLELINFLKKDYANNLYFFTYINKTLCHNPRAGMLVARKNGQIVLVILISPAHCCVSTLDADFISEVAPQLPPIESMHILGRQDYTLRLLDVVGGPERKTEFHWFCKLNDQRLPCPGNFRSIPVTEMDLPELISFYQDNGMLFDCETRVKDIFQFGAIYHVRDDDRVVSSAVTTTETGDMAMIGAVYTDKSQRNKGFAKDCLINLCGCLREKKKSIYLFHQVSDPMVVNMYVKLGFERIGTWVVATRK